MGKDEHRRRLENTMRNRDIVGEPTSLKQLRCGNSYLVVCPTFQVVFLVEKRANLNKDIVIGAAHGTCHDRP